MKTLSTTLVFFLFCAAAWGQDQAKLNREKLKSLSYLIGNWSGSAVVQQPGGGGPVTVKQTETVRWQVDSTLIQVEGIGIDPSGKKSFHALAMIYYNQATQQLAVKSFTMEGRQTDAYFKVVSENNFEWGFDVPNNRGKVRYTIVLSAADKTWVENGEYSPDGSRWMPFLTMNLVKQP